MASALTDTASRVGEQRELARGYSNLAAAGLLWGRYADVRRYLAIGTKLAEASGYAVIRHGLSVMQIYLDWLTGVWGELDARLAVTLDSYHTSQPAYCNALVTAGCLRHPQGALREAHDHLRRTVP